MTQLLYVQGSVTLKSFWKYLPNSYLTIFVECMKNIYTKSRKNLKTFKTFEEFFLIFMQFHINY